MINTASNTVTATIALGSVPIAFGQFIAPAAGGTAAPTIAGSAPGGTVGTAYGFAPTATGSPTFSATGLPPGLSIDGGTGAVTGTPTTAGSFNLVVTATNAGGSATLNATIVIAPAATGPVAATSVPTLSEWGVMLLSLLLALGGVRFVRRAR